MNELFNQPEESLRSNAANIVCRLSSLIPTFDPALPRRRFVNPSEESLEAGLTRELSEELGVALPILEEDHVDSCYAPPSSSSSSSPSVITHFYAKKMEEEQIRELERAAVTTATDHGQEVVGARACPFPSRITDCSH